jgi:hypothetical protein
MNVYTPDRYDERVVHLALGIEPRDATSDRRIDGPLDVRLEEYPAPVHLWRAWQTGETLTGFLPRLQRHRSGRFARCYHEGIPATVDVRLAEPGRIGATQVAGLGRRFVPRRGRFTVASDATVLAAEADPATPPVALWLRVFPLTLFPGPGAHLPARATVLRGRVTMTVDAATGATAPVRWCRVRARNAAGADVGWAHGDDRGEFVLVAGQTETDLVVPVDPLPVTLTIGATVPPPLPDPADPLLATIDPLWDLPIESITASADPANESTITGRRFLPEHALVSPLNPPQPIDLPLGRETSVEIRIA